MFQHWLNRLQPSTTVYYKYLHPKEVFVSHGRWLGVENELERDLVLKMASSRRLDAVDAAVRESTRLVNVRNQFRDGVVPHRGPAAVARREQTFGHFWEEED